MEATGSAALRSRLAVAPVGGPGGRALVADPRNCPILSSRSCSRLSRSTSSGFRAAPYRDTDEMGFQSAQRGCYIVTQNPNSTEQEGENCGQLKETSQLPLHTKTASAYPQPQCTGTKPPNAQKRELPWQRSRELGLSRLLSPG